MKIYRAALRHLEIVKPLFHSYRLFYKPNAVKAESDAFIKQRLTDPNSVIFIAEIDSNPAGLAQLYYSRSSVNVRPVLILNDLYVDSNFRKQGIATQLIETSKDFANQHGIYVLTLETSSTNATAKRLYESLGFQLEVGSDFYELDMPKPSSSAVLSKATTKKMRTVPDMHKFNDKAVVIAGVDNANGNMMVAELDKHGYLVLGCGPDQEKLAELAALYPKADFTLVDVAHAYGTQDWVSYLLEKYGVPSCVINNTFGTAAAVQSVEEDTDSQIKDSFERQVFGCMSVTRQFLPALRLHKQKTAIVNMLADSSTLSAVQIAADAAVQGFTAATARETTDQVTVVCAELTSEQGNTEFVTGITSLTPEQSGKRVKLYIS